MNKMSSQFAGHFHIFNALDCQGLCGRNHTLYNVNKPENGALRNTVQTQTGMWVSGV